MTDKTSVSSVPPQHVTLLRLFQNKHELIDTVNFVLDTLDERTKSIGYVIDQGVGYPVRGNADVVLQLLNAPADVLGVWCWTEVELTR